MQCPICESSEVNELPGKFENVFKCESCTFIFAVPASDSSSPDLYDKDWSKTVVHPTYVYANGEYRLNNGGKLNALLDRLEPFRKVNKILDVGCSAAFFLKLAKDRGWDVQGVEVTEWAAKYSVGQLGVPVFQGLLQDAKFADESFDVVFSSHVVEHIQQPKHLILEMKRILRPGGALVTIVPTQFRSPVFLIWDRWSGEGPPRHVSFFNKKSMARMLESSGFKIHEFAHNVELQELREAIHKSPPEAHGSAGNGRPEPSRSVPVTIRTVKSVVNSVATVFGVGDELCTIAIKD